MNQRSDAARNRSRLLDAARRVFAVHGVHAPLDLVVREASVGRGTLYRHFPDREALIRALLDDRVTLLETAVRRMPEEACLEWLISEFCAYFLDTPGLMTAVRTSPEGRAHMKVLRTRVEVMLVGVVEAARRRGEIRPDITVGDVILLVAMLEGVVTRLDDGDRAVRALRAAELVVRSLRDPSRDGLPLPGARLSHERHSHLR
jgi:AcrR family transcriptional regulator